MPYALTLLAFPLVYYLTHAEIPYRLPIEPELVVLASFAVVSHRKPTLNPSTFSLLARKSDSNH
jgi:hypothetical protein